MKTVRCAIYTRKSSEEGLEQGFNSLDAQREACAAYILSQASEGWVALPDIYDDGGISGGTLERPALQRLLAEVTAGRIDIIVVYKVDRLTRSLLDFAKLVEAFDKAGTSFVSITQSFNTTTSMGRLTLNMLLSFAQFEREVTAERIRDKIAASKAKGMWMGGIPPLGYRPDGRSLAIVEEHAAIVRTVFEHYLEIGNVRILAEQLMRTGVTSPVRKTATGKQMGGGPFTRGQLYLMLKCHTFVGEISHKQTTFPGLHPAIIDRDLFERVQALLASNLQGRRAGAYAKNPSLLAGKVVDAAGVQLLAVHATKGAARYRYYVSQAVQRGEGDGMRIPARELEAAVLCEVASAFDDGLAMAAKCSIPLLPADVTRVSQHSQDIDARAAVRSIVDRVRIGPNAIEIDCSTAAVAKLLGVAGQPATPTLILVCAVRLTRTGRVLQLVQQSGQPLVDTQNAALVRLIAKAHRWWSELRTGQARLGSIAERERVQPAYVTRVLRLAFLSPAIIEAVLAGRQRAGVDGMRLTATGAIDAHWEAQQARFLPARTGSS